MDEQKLLTEGMILEIGENESEAPERVRPRRPLATTVIALVLLAVSVFMHVSFIAEGIQRLLREGSAPLLSVLIPDYEISEPLKPPLPESIDLEAQKPSAPDIKEEPSPERPAFITADLSAKAEFGLALNNETTYLPELYTLLGSVRSALTEKELDSIYSEDCPKVLIYHTHATESYRDTEGTSFRTEDNENNTVAVGKVIASVLESAGIETIHLTEQFDKEDWSLAYENSHKAVLDILEKHPSIEYVFDVHRDCIGNEKDGFIRTATPISGRDTAQLMFVCGTDEGGSGHTEWRSNLSFALSLQSALYEKHPSLMRPINLRRASFYQDTSPQALILECGTCGCTLEEAKRGAVYFAVTLADYIKGEPSGISCDAMIQSICP